MPAPAIRRAALALTCLLAAIAPGARAGELDGVTLPDSIEAAGARLRLNGMGVRTFSIFDIHIYVAGLYLEHLSHDPVAILNEPEVKVIEFRFVHDAGVERVRHAWEEGFQQDCDQPCRVTPEEVAKFLAATPGLNKGDSSTIVFAKDSVTIAVNGRVLGTITDPPFMRLLLATFIGPHPPTERLKRGLLGLAQ